ncbi:MAG: oligosaccharide flippase family protein, partial [Roseburia sp.]|nr:oligosaccharide flippase family protein [Roseburia sp.]
MGEIKGYFGHRASLKRLGSLAAAKGVNAIVALLRGKLTALLLGPEGMGVAALLMSTATTIQNASGLGMNLSGVKAVASGADHAALTLRRLFLGAALLAGVATVILAPWLGEATFGNNDSVAAFRILSPGVFFASLAAGEFAILQGRRAMTRLARSSAIGAVVGLLPAVPLYLCYGLAGIAPSLVVASAVLWVSLRLAAGRSPQGSRFDRKLARQLVTTGMMMMSSLVAGAAVAWLTLVAIRSFSSVAEAGLYQSANATVARATEMVFAALSLDFFPALAMVARSTP